MPIKRYTVGPGTLTLGGGGSAFDLSAQVTNCRVEWSESTSNVDPIAVLTGEETGADSTTSYSATLAGNLIQDLTVAGTVAYTWAHKGEELPFTFVPSTAEGRAVTGTVRVGPITLGGDAKDKTPRSDFSWPCIGTPILGAAA